MTDYDLTDPADEPLPDDIVALLGRDAVWDEPDPALEDAVFAAIQAEIDLNGRPAEIPDPPPDPEIVPDGPGLQEPEVGAVVRPLRRQSRWRPALGGAAVAAAVMIAVFGFTRATDPAPDVELALAGTDLAPEATADVGIRATPIGTELTLDVSGLAPAPPGMVYEAWMRIDAQTGVSAGTFHLRGGDGEVTLWTGVLVEDYPLVTVTLQEEGQEESSGVVVLRGLVGEDDSQ